MHVRPTAFLPLLVLCLTASPARADTQTHVATIPMTEAAWADGFSVPRFDPSAGTLQSVRVGLTADYRGSIGLENIEPTPVTWMQGALVTTTVTVPDGPALLVTELRPSVTVTLGPADGLVDFDGLSGATFELNELDLTRRVLEPGTHAEIEHFVGPPGAPGLLALPAAGELECTAPADGNPVHFCTAEVGATLTVTYVFEPRCAPPSQDCAIERYCTAGTNSSGEAAILSLLGSLSVPDNDLALLVTGLPPETPALFLYSPDQARTPLGNGTLCVGDTSLGFVLRLRAETSDETGQLLQAVDLAAPPDPSGRVTPGSTWCYQAWFRDLEAGGAGFDFSDALRVTFVM